ncbi:MAG: hypothetical protein IJ461_10365 [Clostridia bacterium]|nr:hypothetical protein [Clostridia bacterium]
MKRKGLAWGVWGLAAFLFLLLILTAAEASCPEASIRSFSDALWYSLTTLTTVGYGDLYPISPVGRLIGGTLMLMSVGLLAAVIGWVVGLVKGLLPRLALYALRRSDWFLFSEFNAASQALAADLARQHPGCVRIFGSAGDGKPRQKGCFFLPQKVTEILPSAAKSSGKRTVFLISPDPFKNVSDALKLKGSPAAVCCLGPENPLLKGVSFFDPFELCARRFWQAHPLEGHEECVLIAGSGSYAQALLENALLSQARQPFKRCAYHLFGDWSRWRSLHPAIGQALAVEEDRPGMDGLYFHTGNWFEHQALMERAQRIILCHEEESENLRDALDFSRCFAGGQTLYVRALQAAVPGIAFGLAHDLYTAEMVMKQGLDALARRMHDTYRAQHPQAPAWEQLDAFTQASNRAAADHVATKKRLLAGENYSALSPGRREEMRRCEHDRWLRFYSLHNWRFGQEKDARSRRHPCMLPYEQLSAADQAKDDYAWQQMEESS